MRGYEGRSREDSDNEEEFSDEATYHFTGEPQKEENILNRFKHKVSNLISAKSDQLQFILDNETSFWWNPPWYVFNVIDANDLREHLRLMDNPDLGVRTLLGFQSSLTNHNHFVLASHYFGQGSYGGTELVTRIEVSDNDLLMFVARLLKDGLELEVLT